MKARNRWTLLLFMVAGCSQNEVNDVESGMFVPIETFLSCPDNNHPHAIDLGLPSGTKWCCCNVGANSPDSYGNYYVWSETDEESTCNKNIYAYRNEWGNPQCVNFDIVSTSSDVARVCMGTPWRMPSVEQMKELYDNCSRQQTLKNGVNGILVIGSNGGQIFLPTAGWHQIDGFDLTNSADPSYSSSSLINSYYAYELYFYFGGWYWDNNYSGLSVRAVCP